MKKRLFAAVMVSIAVLTLSGYSFVNQTGTVNVDGSSRVAGVMQSILDSADKDCQGIIETLNADLAGVHKQKADPAVLNGIAAEYYGSYKPISEIANIRVQRVNELVIEPHDLTCLGSIEKAILSSDIGITPENDGKCLILRFPQLTVELRKKIIEEITSYGEEAKRRIQDIRKDKLVKLKEKIHSGEITRDEANAVSNKLKQSLDEKMIKVNAILQENQNAIMT